MLFNANKISQLRRISAMLLILFLLVPALLAAQDKRPLEIEDFAQWKSISQQKISNNGEWAAYVVSPIYGNGKIVFRNLEDETEYTYNLGKNPGFYNNDKMGVFIVGPPKDDNNKEDKKIKPSLGIIDLSNGEITLIEEVTGYKVSEDGNWGAYSKSAPEKPKDDDKKDKNDKKKLGTEVILRNLLTGDETTYPETISYRFDENSEYFLTAVASEDETKEGLFAHRLSDASAITILAAPGKYEQFAWDEDHKILAFVHDAGEWTKENPNWKVYSWTAGAQPAELMINSEDGRGFAGNMMVAKSPNMDWAKDSRTLFFDMQETPAPKDTTIKEEDLPSVDVWHWKDVVLQTQQKIRLDRLRNQGYRAAYSLSLNRTVRLADEQIENVMIAPNDMLAAGGDVREYEWEAPYNPEYQDLYLINIADGSKTLVHKKLYGRPRWSDSGKYLYWFEGHNWHAYSIEEGVTTNLTEDIAIDFHDTVDDHPAVKRAWGAAGWSENDEEFLIYDQFDIWAVSMRGEEPQNITGGEGRRRDVQFRYLTFDNDEEFIDLDNPILLTMFNNKNKNRGIYRLKNGSKNPIKLLDEPKNGGTPIKAKNADVLLFTLEDFQTFPDLHVSDMEFKTITKISDVNPQQKDFLWGTEQLIEWRSSDGIPLQGVLFLPENYEVGTTKLPLVLYIYEKMSQRFRTHSPPIANHRFNATEYTSQGYAVLYPDIVYKDGLPGPSSKNCLIPAVQKVIDMGIADPARVGIQGHSWGGYETAYLATQTDMFAAICTGAPVSNMTSAYGGIRWGTGNPRTFQYETGQSRIGGTLWEKPELYIENSPIFFMDRINTPLLIHHGDEDGAVPWYQSIEYYLALRRLNKPSWFLQYNGEPHHLQKKANKYDWTKRMFQFFEHYLKDAPMPEWMEHGVPRLQKGRK